MYVRSLALPGVDKFTTIPARRRPRMPFSSLQTTIMRAFRLASSILASLMFAGAAGAAEAPPAPGVRVIDLASGFLEAYERNAATSAPAFVEDFKASVAARFPEFYGIERYEGKRTQAERDKQIAAAYEAFPALREAYRKKVERFTRDLPLYTASFQKAFPDYRPKGDLYFVHSLGEMDGGMRSFKGRSYFIFGADMMTRIHGEGDEAGFFHHELFHDYHATGCAEERVWTSLWQEGLATYVSRTMNPSASNAELLLDFPRNLVSDTERQLDRAFEHLAANLESKDPAVYAGLFMMKGDGTGLPARRGYYLGYLVAREAGKTRDLQALAKLQCADVRKVVYETVERLRARPAVASH